MLGRFTPRVTDSGESEAVRANAAERAVGAQVPVTHATTTD